MPRFVTFVLAAAALLLAPGTAMAGWKAVLAGQPVAVAKSGLTVTPPGGAWNRSSSRPTKKSELWTQDGLALNELAFFSGVAPGEPIYRELNKKLEPLPKFDSKMLAPDIVAMFEASNRILLKTSLFTVDAIEPAKLAGHSGFRFAFTYTTQGVELRRKGEGRAAVIGGKLYLMTFIAPELHYYRKGIAEARAIMDSARIVAVAKR